jgi:hypothetical protein
MTTLQKNFDTSIISIDDDILKNPELKIEKNSYEFAKNFLIVVIVIFAVLLIPININTIDYIESFKITENTSDIEIKNMTQNFLKNYIEMNKLFDLAMVEIVLVSLLVLTLLSYLCFCGQMNPEEICLKTSNEQKFCLITIIQSLTFLGTGIYGIQFYNTQIYSIIPNFIFAIVNLIISLIYGFIHFGFYDSCKLLHKYKKIKKKKENTIVIEKKKTIADYENPFLFMRNYDKKKEEEEKKKEEKKENNDEKKENEIIKNKPNFEKSTNYYESTSDINSNLDDSINKKPVGGISPSPQTFSLDIQSINPLDL